VYELSLYLTYDYYNYHRMYRANKFLSIFDLELMKYCFLKNSQQWNSRCEERSYAGLTWIMFIRATPAGPLNTVPNLYLEAKIKQQTTYI
jgi:hypothetical protein